ncbi:hypothetical protein [Agromyces sp. NPDC055658]
MAIDHIGKHGGWGQCDDCCANIRMTEITSGFFWPMVKHESSCPQLREATC